MGIVLASAPAPASDCSAPRLLLPAHLYAVVNEPSEIWRDNVALRDGYCAQSCRVLDGPAALRVYDHLEDRWRVFPTTAGNYTLEVGAGGQTKTATLHVAPALPAEAPVKRVAPVGDSITAAVGDGGYVRHLSTALGARMVLLGTQTNNTYKSEGFPGSQWQRFATQFGNVPEAGVPNSPFCTATSTINIPAWRTAVGADPDLVTWSLGTNDIYPTDLAAVTAKSVASFAYAEALISAFKAALPSARHLLVPCWPGNANAGAWAGGAAPALTYRQKAHLWAELLEARFASREAEGIYHLGGSFLQIDRARGYPSNNDIHPDVNAGHVTLARTLRHWMTWQWVFGFWA